MQEPKSEEWSGEQVIFRKRRERREGWVKIQIS